MNATASITFRTDPELKAEVEEILDDIGMNLSTAFNCFMKKVRDVGGIPFELTRNAKRQKMLAAYNEAKAEMQSPDAEFCDDPAKLHDFLFK